MARYNTPIHHRNFVLDIAGTSRELSHVSLLALILAIALLATACGPSTPPATAESSLQPTTAAALTSDLPPAEFPPSKYLRFARLTTEDGLSSDQAWRVAQDGYGFMWFATVDGLNRYDGNDLKIYRHNSDDPSSLSNNLARALVVDQSGIPWIGTWGGGLNEYDPEKDAFIHYQHDPDNPYSLSSDLVRSVYADRDGTIWVGTAGGLNKLDRDSGQFTYYQHDPDDPNSLSHNLVWSIHKDSAGVLWIGTENGFNRFDPSTEQFVRYQHDSDDPSSLSHDTVREIFEDRSGILWLSTPGGLSKFDRDRTRFTRYLHNTSDPQSIISNVVTGVYEDRAGRLWVSTWGSGLVLFDRETEAFTHFKHNPNDPYSLGADTVFEVLEDQRGVFWVATVGGISLFDGGGKPFQHYRSVTYLPNTLNHNVVRALHAGRSGTVWVGTEGGGFNKFDRSTEEFTHYRHDPDDPNSLSNDSVRAIYEDQTGMVWIGTEISGLSRFDPETERFSHFPHDPADPRSISKGSINGINEDRSGTLWISTWGGGLNAFDRESEQFTRYQHDPADPQTLSHNQVIIAHEDRAGELWIGTLGGLNRFDREAETFTRYLHDPTDPSSLGHASVTSIHEDQTGTLWIGNFQGLDKFDRENDQFTHYTTANGLPSELVWGILEDEQGRLWLSTANGLSRFDPWTESFRNYDITDGLQSNTFLNFSSYSKSQDGEMFFGGSNGFNAFFPDQIVDNLHPPPVLITDFQLANKPVPIAADSVLQKSILATDSLLLSYQDRMFSFEFAGLNYRASEKNRYKYKIEGFDNEWNEVDSTRRFATYTNLDPGDYVFRVIASNNDGIWNEEGASIKITITPPWWQTTWFRIGLGLLIAGLLATGYFWRIRSIEKRSQELEALVIERTAALNSAEEQIQSLFETSQVGIALSTYDGDLLAANPILLDMIGYKEEEIVDLDITSLFANPDERTEMLNQLEAEQSVRGFGVKAKRKDGTDLFVNLNVSLTKRGDEDILLALIEDVTDKTIADADLIESELRFRALFQGMPVPVYTWQRRGEEIVLVDHNNAADEFTGGSVKQVIGSTLTEMYPDRPDIVEDVSSCMTEKVITRKEMDYTFKDTGEDRVLAVTYASVPPDLVIVQTQDITDRKLREAQQVEAATQSERDRLGRDLHDSVTQGIYSASLIAETLPLIWEDDPELGKQGLIQLERFTKGALAEMRTLLLEMQPEAMADQELPYLIRQLADTMMARVNTSISTTVIGDCEVPPEIKIALYRITQEALNNVVKHSQASHAEIFLEQDCEQIILRVSDDGIGFISEDTRSLGIGIGIMKKRSRDIDATLSVTSQPGEGTQVLVTYQILTQADPLRSL